jgi:hypothetical protein
MIDRTDAVLGWVFERCPWLGVGEQKKKSHALLQPLADLTDQPIGLWDQPAAMAYRAAVRRREAP